jgi:hypothetical protein
MIRKGIQSAFFLLRRELAAGVAGDRNCTSTDAKLFQVNRRVFRKFLQFS